MLPQQPHFASFPPSSRCHSPECRTFAGAILPKPRHTPQKPLYDELAVTGDEQGEQISALAVTGDEAGEGGFAAAAASAREAAPLLAMAEAQQFHHIGSRMTYSTF